MNDKTTICLSKELKEELDKLKSIPQEPYYAVVERLLNHYKTTYKEQ